jgi:DNA-binding NtrC family response regulator
MLQIDDAAIRLTLKTMLEAEGHYIVKDHGELLFSDDPARARVYAARMPVLLLATAAGIPAAVEAMREGVYGYVFLPFQPGEASLMVQRALRTGNLSPREEEKALTLAEAEWRHIEATLRRCRYNQAQAARELGIGRNTLWRKLRARKQTPQSYSSGKHSDRQ